MKKVITSVFLSLLFTACDRPIPPLQSDQQESLDQEFTLPETPLPQDFSLTKEDENITQKLRTKLTAQDFQSAPQIKIITHQGIVTLRGTVQNIQEKNRVERSALRIKDVKAVENLLEIQQE